MSWLGPRAWRPESSRKPCLGLRIRIWDGEELSDVGRRFKRVQCRALESMSGSLIMPYAPCVHEEALLRVAELQSVQCFVGHDQAFGLCCLNLVFRVVSVQRILVQ